MEIQNFNNYLIYPNGKVYSKKTKRYLKHQTDKYRYKKVSLCKDGKPKTHIVHRLVALHYIPNPENKREVDHINRDRKDNRVQNLRWVTSSENQQNTGKQKNNTSGIKNISYNKTYDNWRYKKVYRGKLCRKYFKTLKEALCYKYIYIGCDCLSL
jgi:hypothetical protein